MNVQASWRLEDDLTALAALAGGSRIADHGRRAAMTAARPVQPPHRSERRNYARNDDEDDGCDRSPSPWRLPDFFGSSCEAFGSSGREPRHVSQLRPAPRLPEAPRSHAVLSTRTTSDVVLLATSCPTFRSADVSAIAHSWILHSASGPQTLIRVSISQGRSIRAACIWTQPLKAEREQQLARSPHAADAIMRRPPCRKPHMRITVAPKI